MATHLGKYVSEKRGANPVITAALVALKLAYEGASLLDAAGSAITDASARVWRMRVPASTTPPYGRIWGAMDGHWSDGSTRNNIPTSTRINVKHTAAYPDVAATMASAFHDYITGTDLAPTGFRVVTVEPDMDDVEQHELDEAGDLYHVNQRYRFLMRAL